MKKKESIRESERVRVRDQDTTYIRYGVACLVLFLIPGVSKALVLWGPGELPFAIDFFRSMITQVSFLMCIFLWGALIRRRLVQKNSRRLVLASVFMLVLWLLLKFIRYDYFLENEQVSRWLWYAYYIPQILNPVFMLLTALSIGQPDKTTSVKKAFWLFLPALILLVLIMTNDVHQWAFSFNENFLDWSSSYRHGWLYVLVMIWQVGLIVIGLVILYNKCTIMNSRKLLWVPFGCIVFGAVLIALSFFHILELYRIPELFCLTYMLLLESSLEIGIIPSNRHYTRFFMESGISAAIIGNDGRPVYASRAMEELTPDQVSALRQGPLMVGKDTRLSAREISGGMVVWSDDLTPINRLNDHLTEIRDRLSEENDLLAAENELKAQQASVAETSRLYDKIDQAVHPQIASIKSLSENFARDDADRRRRLGLIGFYGAYVKRQSNLALIAERFPELDIREIGLSIKESLDYLGLCGVECAIWQTGEGVLSRERAQASYAFFERVVETSLASLTALSVNLSGFPGLVRLRFALDGTSALSDADGEAMRALGGTVSLTHEDETEYIDVLFKSGGGA